MQKRVLVAVTDFEKIGFKKDGRTTDGWELKELSESWVGEIKVNGASQYLEVLIFDNKPDELTCE